MLQQSRDHLSRNITKHCRNSKEEFTCDISVSAREVLNSLPTLLCYGQRVFLYRTVFCNASVGVLTSGIPDCHLKGESFKAQQLMTFKKSIFGLQTKEGWVKNFKFMFGTDCC